MEALITLVILTIVSTKLTLGSSSPAQKCEYNITPLAQYSQFGMHGESLKTRTRLIIIEKSNTTWCYVNTTDVVETFNFTEEPLVAILLLYCRQATYVYFTPFDQPKHNNVIGYIQTETCKLCYKSIEQFSRIMDVRVVNLIDGGFSEPCIDIPTECPGLQATASLTYYNCLNPPENFTKIFSCSDLFPELAEVSFWNMSWSELPSFLPERLINLQVLQVPYSKFTVPPYFPWINEEKKLPRNLSRTRYLQNHYSEIYGLDIPTNIFRRYFNLNYNQISDLSNFSFHGYLHMLTIKSNHLVRVGIETFRNVSGLQHLDLSENELEQIPMGIFKGLGTLRYLKLHRNKIQELGTGIFDDLQSLVYLNVANNNISMLPKGLFTRMGKLEVLYLEYNNISVIEREAFPVDSIALKSVVLHNNPLLFMPEFIFEIRGLFLVDLRSTLISFSRFIDLIDSIDIYRLFETVIESPSSANIPVYKKGEKFRLIDLTNGKVENIYLHNMTLLRRRKLILMIQHYHFKLDANPLSCSCDIIPFHSFINELLTNKIIKGDEYYFTEWKCEIPVELRGRRMLDVKPEETYCPIIVSGCPEDCSCYQRSVNLNVIVDCRWRNLFHLHNVMPHGNLELWYNGNKIKNLNDMNYLSFVKVLDLSDNSITKLETSTITKLSNVQKLYLHSNLLTYLPKDIADIGFEVLTLKYNPFRCDCRTLWMKGWMAKRKEIVIDWSDTKCNNIKEEGKQFLLVPDSEFVCEEDFDSLRHVIIPTVTSAITLLIVIMILVIVYAYRLECKVLIYIYFGVHPFDKVSANKDEVVDAVIVHSVKQTDWVMDHIVNILEETNHNFHICDMARDFVIGFTFQENLNQVVRHSKRMILLISEDWETDDETFKVAWNIAQEKIKESKSNFGIIINHGVSSTEIKDKALLRFIRRGRYIDSKHKLFVEKMLYSMPIKVEHIQKTRPNVRSLIQAGLSIQEGAVNNNMNHAFISYSEEDREFVTNDLVPKLEMIGYNLCLPDRDFIPGASKEENILKAIDVSLRTIFILSGSHIKDEWSLFTFITACEKTLREKTNYLIVIIREDVHLDKMDEEVKHYLRTYISLHVNDRWFWSKLLNGLPPNGW